MSIRPTQSHQVTLTGDPSRRACETRAAVGVSPLAQLDLVPHRPRSMARAAL